MKKNKKAVISYNLILLAGFLYLITNFTKYNYDWIVYLSGVFALIGVILYVLSKRKKE
jgi:multidrug efflux pump subunit AcrB|tara:strand:+ start:80 stop:253 length:174 start_codon:yes stop_codon:yes gene_type:complete